MVTSGLNPETIDKYRQSIELVAFFGTRQSRLFRLVISSIKGGATEWYQLEYLDKQSNVMGGPRKIRSRGSWSHIVSKATDA